MPEMKKNQLILVLLLFSPILHFFAFSQETWHTPDGFASDKYYRVKVNGIPVPVFDTPIASYVIFDMTGEANIEVNTMFDVRWIDIRPLRWALAPQYTGDNSFCFKMKEPANLSIELNERIRQQPLFIFAGKPETEKPLRADKNVIWFQSGKLYKDIRLELQDNQTVYIEGGAVVQGCIYAKGKKNIKIIGRGILDGSFNKTNKEFGDRFIQFYDCENVSINGITLHNGTTWQVALFHCNKVDIKGIRLVSESASDDGIDICRCTNVVVDDVFAHTKDDCVAIKSHGNYPDNHPTDNILIKNCVFWNSIWGNAIEVGFELNSDEVKNIRIENIDVIHVEDGATISIHNAGKAHVHNVVFENIRVEDSRQKLFDLAIFSSQYSPDGNSDPEYNAKYYLHGAWDGVQKIPVGTESYHSNYRGKISNVVFKNIQVTGGLLPFSVFHGFDQTKNVSEITIENLTYMGKHLTNTENAKIRQQNTVGLTIK
jgi:hypothetical protein